MLLTLFSETRPDPNTTLVVGSVTTTQGTVVTGNNAGDTTVEVNVGAIPDGTTVTIQFQVTVNNPLPAGVTQIRNQGRITGDNIPPKDSDDPDTGPVDDPTDFTTDSAPPTSTPVPSPTNTPVVLDAPPSDGSSDDDDDDGNPPPPAPTQPPNTPPPPLAPTSAPTPTPEFPTTLPETGEPPVNSGAAIIMTFLVALVSLGLLIKLRALLS